MLHQWKNGFKRKKWRKYVLVAGARVLLAAKMDIFLFLPCCFRPRIKVWVTSGCAEIGKKPQVTTATTFRELLISGP